MPRDSGREKKPELPANGWVSRQKSKKGKTDETSIPFVKSKRLGKILFVKTQAVNGK